MNALLPWYSASATLFTLALCTPQLNVCNPTLLLDGDYECVYVEEGTYRSLIHVFMDEPGSERTITEHHGLPETQRKSGSVHLSAFPIYVEPPGRYKVHLCVDVLAGDLRNASLVTLEFSVRRESPDFHKFVHHQDILVNDNGASEYIRLGCYWHFHMLLAIQETTVEVLATLHGNRSGISEKYYFRIPFWEFFNGQKNVDPCLFPPFVYAGSDGGEVDYVFLRNMNCSRTVPVNVQQKKEFSDEVISTKWCSTEGMHIVRLNFTSTSHKVYFFSTVMDYIEDADDSETISPLFLPILTVLIFMITSCIWLLKRPKSSGTASLSLKSKLRVKFLYSKAKGLEMYQKQTEILIMFMEEFCNVVAVDSVHQLQEATENTSLSEGLFDGLVWVPFPGEHYPDEKPNAFEGGERKRTKENWIVIFLPFWSPSPEEHFREMKRWKRFELMCEFEAFLRHLHGTRSFSQKQYSHEMSAEQLRQKLEDHNLTNDAFHFCANWINFEPDPCDKFFDFPDLQQMML